MLHDFCGCVMVRHCDGCGLPAAVRTLDKTTKGLSLCDPCYEKEQKGAKTTIPADFKAGEGERHGKEKKVKGKGKRTRN